MPGPNQVGPIMLTRLGFEYINVNFLRLTLFSFFFFVNNFLLKYRYAQQLKKREKGV